jgi:transposase
MRNKANDAVPNEAQSNSPHTRQARLSVSSEDQRQVVALLESAALRPGHRRRLRVILLTALGRAGGEIAAEVGISRFHVSRVRARFGKGGLSALADRPRLGRKSSVSPERAAEVVAAARSNPPPGSQRWTLSLLSNRLGLSRSVIYRILRRRLPGLRPTPDADQSLGPHS